jgi:hypothetical protein
MSKHNYTDEDLVLMRCKREGWTVHHEMSSNHLSVFIAIRCGSIPLASSPSWSHLLAKMPKGAAA